MKTTILRLMMAATLLTGMSYAEAPHRGDRMAQKLGLSDDQRTQMKEIMKEQRQAMMEARKNKASREDFKAIRATTHQKVAGVLTPEQLQKYDAAARHHRAKRRAAKS